MHRDRSIPWSATAGRSPESRVVLLNPLDEHDWDQRVAALPGVGFFHGSAWARVLRNSYGFEPRYHVAMDNGRPSAVLPMMEVDSWATGRRAVSLPFTDGCEPLAQDPGVFARLFGAAKEDARKRRWAYLELRGGKALLPDTPSSFSFFGHRLPLDPDPARLLTRIRPAARRGIRVAREQGLTAEVTHSFQAMVAFYDLLVPTRRRHGVPPQPFRFFAEIHENIIEPRQGCIVLVRAGNRPVAGAIFLHFGRLAIYKFGASLQPFQRMRPNNLLMWHAIRWHARAGFTDLDLGRTACANDGLRRFKLSWGADEYPIDYFRYNPRAAKFVAMPERMASWQRRLFQTLPLPISRALGSALYKHVG